MWEWNQWSPHLNPAWGKMFFLKTIRSPYNVSSNKCPGTIKFLYQPHGSLHRCHIASCEWHQQNFTKTTICSLTYDLMRFCSNWMRQGYSILILLCSLRDSKFHYTRKVTITLCGGRCFYIIGGVTRVNNVYDYDYVHLTCCLGSWWRSCY